MAKKVDAAEAIESEAVKTIEVPIDSLRSVVIELTGDYFDAVAALMRADGIVNPASLAAQSIETLRKAFGL